MIIYSDPRLVLVRENRYALVNNTMFGMYTAYHPLGGRGFVYFGLGLGILAGSLTQHTKPLPSDDKRCSFLLDYDAISERRRRALETT